MSFDDFGSWEQMKITEDLLCKLGFEEVNKNELQLGVGKSFIVYDMVYKGFTLENERAEAISISPKSIGQIHHLINMLH